jgi:anti-sigma B factor antagonist
MYVKDRPLVIKVARQGRAVVCRLIGSATMETCSLLNERLCDVWTEADGALLIELSELNFICSLGLGSIVAAYTRAIRQAGAIRLVAPSDAVRDMLVMTKLDTLIPVYDSVEEAAASLPTTTT